MARVPNPPQSGKAILPWAIEVTAFLRSAVARGIGVRTGASGTSFRIPRGLDALPFALQRPVQYRPFQIEPSSSDGDDPQPRLRVYTSTIGGALPTGFTADDSTPFLLVPAVGSWLVLVKVTTSGGSVTGREIIQAATLPENTATVHYAILGGYTFSAEAGFTAYANTGFGPVDVDDCYEDFTNPPVYNFTLSLK